MSLVRVNWNPNSKELNGFRIISVVAGVLIAAVLYLFGDADLRWCGAIAVAGACIALGGFVSLRLTRYIYIGMVAITLPIGLAISLTLMATFYFGLIAPLGLLFRLIGRDPLCRRFDPKARSYWVPHQQTTRMERYFQQF